MKIILKLFGFLLIVWVSFYIGYLIEIDYEKWYSFPYVLSCMLSCILYVSYFIDKVIDGKDK